MWFDPNTKEILGVADVLARGISASEESDLSAFGLPTIIVTPKPGDGYTLGEPEEIGGVLHTTWVEPEPLPFAERQAALIRQVDLLAREKRDAIVADISPAEMASWPIKRAEALAYQSSGLESDAPNLAVEAEARDCSLADLVAKVLSKAEQLAYIEAQIAGHTGKLQDQLRAVDDGDMVALEAIDITAGWPL